MNIEITDQTGKGNKDIVSIYGKEAFEIMARTLTVKIPYNPLAFGDTTTSNLILELIKNNNQITAREIAEHLNLTKDGAQYHLNKLKQEGKIVRHGGNFGGTGKL